jgi:uncharacterized membrane protein (GlpM family)
MIPLIVKIVITTALVVLISEVQRRSNFVAALIMSLPVVSILTMTWVFLDKKDPSAVAKLSTSTLWLVLPSLVLFIVLPIMLRRNVGFALSMTVACAATIASYFVMVFALARAGVKL